MIVRSSSRVTPLAAAMLLWSVVSGASGATRAAAREGAIWRPSFAPAMKEARDSGKPLLLVFYTKWCAYCAKMHKTTLENPALQETIAKFVPAMVDAEVDLVAAKRFAPVGFPVVVVVDPSGREIVRFLGYQPADRFGPVLASLSDSLPEISGLYTQLEGKDTAGGAAQSDGVPGGGATVGREAIQRQLGDLYIRCGLPSKAYEVYEKALKRMKKDSMEREGFLWRAAEAATQGGDAQQGERLWRRLLEEFPSSDRRPEYLLGLGKALLAEGRAEKARGTLEQLGAEHAGTPQAEEAARLLATPSH